MDVVTGGSPCQDLSVAGKRAGLAGERSGLYMEQIRCVKELRAADVLRGRTGEFIRPRYMVWENVPGAFSSGKPKGADFAAVIEEIIKVAEPDAYVCVMPPSSGWSKSGCYYDSDGRWSIAWRVHDAQFWGVPQRRKRISLVADFGGLSAPEILFERKGLSGHFEQSRAQREGAAAAVGDGAAGAISFQERAGCPGGGKGILIQPERTGALSTLNNQSVFCLQGNVVDRDANCNGKGWRDDDVSFALNTIDRHAITQPLCIEMTSTKNTIVEDGICPTLTARMGTGGNQVNAVCISGDDVADTLDASYYKGCGERGFKERTVVADRAAVRRLTPLERERLQGYPDGWTDIGEWVDSKGKRHKEADSPRYKALGNSIALPFWCWLAKRISAQYERDITIGSLFDGIGGFPYAFEKCGGKALWASEIEEFPIAVTKIRFPEEEHHA